MSHALILIVSLISTFKCSQNNTQLSKKNTSYKLQINATLTGLLKLMSTWLVTWVNLSSVRVQSKQKPANAMIHPDRMLYKLEYPRNQLHMSIKRSSWLYYFVSRHYGNLIPNKGFVTIFSPAGSTSIVGCYRRCLN